MSLPERLSGIPSAVPLGDPRVVVSNGGWADPIGELLVAIANGDREACVSLESRIGGLVHLNIRRVLRDASRSDAVTQEFFADVPQDAIDFDPDEDNAQAWLLTRAHLRAMSAAGDLLPL